MEDEQARSDGVESWLGGALKKCRMNSPTQHSGEQKKEDRWVHRAIF
jgi:hypothetical protein